MNDDRNSIEEHVLEAFYAEALGDQGPPDLSDQILRRLSDEDVAGATSIVTQPRSDSATRVAPAEVPAASGHRFAISVGVIAVIAATLMAIVLLNPSRGLPIPQTVVDAEPAEDTAEDLSDETDLASGPGAVDAQPTPDQREPLHGVPLVIDRDRINDVDPQGDNEIDFGSDAVVQSPGLEPLLEVTLVSRRMANSLQDYWSEVGVDPTQEAEAAEVVARLESVLGIKLPAEAVTDSEILEQELSKTDVANAVAESWLAEITEGGLRRVSAESRELLIRQLSQVLQDQRPFDDQLLSWLSGKDSQTSAFYAAITAGPAHARDHESRVRRLAQFTMNVDLRCTRCHDAYIEGRGRQHDHHSFASFIRRRVTKDSEGQWKIDSTQEANGPLFYESADGRQRLAVPVVPAGWLTAPQSSNSNADSLQEITTVDQWVERLSGSPELARGVVNSLWSLVHGQPLRGRVIDPITAPFSDSLQEIESFLVQDLLASDFDVTRTLSLIIASPVARRSVPEALLPENALVADQQAMQRAMNAVDAFAAALPLRPPMPLKARVAMALRSVGASLGADGQPFVAQIGESGNDQAAPTDLDSLAIDLPREADAPPVQWLARISDREEQLEHLAYLAGLQELPDDVKAAAEVTDQAEASRNLTLHRVWWMLKP